MTASPSSSSKDTARSMCTYIDASPSPYHACATAAMRLEGAGFSQVEEGAPWAGPGAADSSAVPRRGFVIRGGALLAWALPSGAADADSSDAVPSRGFRVIGAHTDSPNLRVKPRPDSGRAGFRQIGVEVYGGVLVNSWLDRDLGLSGRAFVTADGDLREHLFLIDRPIMRVPQLAIHLDRDVVAKGLVLDKQQHMSPVMAVGDRTEGAFNELLAAELGVPSASIKSYDAMLHDLTPSRLIGSDESMVSAPRLDNLCSSFVGVEALIAATDAGATRPLVVTLFDHEEVGSGSRGGADGPILGDVLERLVLAQGGTREDYLRSLNDSICFSADMAHAVHPNYPEKHEPDHHVFMNSGPVIKINANQRYATEAETEALFQVACESAGVPFQKWVMRTNMACGSTIGPITAAALGMRTVDIGCPQLSMHSARELCGTHDPHWMVQALTEALKG